MIGSKFLPSFATGIAVVLTLGYFGYYMKPHRDRADDFHYRDFGRIPGIDGGRYKPLDTIARTNLMLLTHRQAFYDAEADVRYPATKWWLDVLTTPPPNEEILNELFPNGAEQKVAWKYKIFRIENDQVLQLLNLKMRAGLRYSVNEIAPNIDKLVAEAQRIRGLDAKQEKNLFDAKVMELWRNLNLFVQLSGHSTPLVIPNPDGSDQWKSFRAALDELTQNQGKFGDDVDGRTFGVYVKLLRHYDQKETSEFNKLLTEHLTRLESTSPR